ncbi:hypothetical protein EVAR_29394_1 [Eumeta japonica]|uniref:Uncharacterized protein n=1 Tax=Eumeta variegata TaxID=151549 RepID=A0A4C1ZR12_EUMVA|nr:hypothetical protein EVAR_29394_1 [Eumeta japonica]
MENAEYKIYTWNAHLRTAQAVHETEEFRVLITFLVASRSSTSLPNVVIKICPLFYERSVTNSSGPLLIHNHRRNRILDRGQCVSYRKSNERDNRSCYFVYVLSECDVSPVKLANFRYVNTHGSLQHELRRRRILVKSHLDSNPTLDLSKI